MEGSGSNPLYYREKGLEFLQKGKQVFNTHTELEYRQKGYELYKKGLDYLIKYAKSEKDGDLVAKLKANLPEWMKEAQSMGATLAQFNSQNQPQQPTSNGNNYAPPQQNYQQPQPNQNNGYQPSNNYQQPTNNNQPPRDNNNSPSRDEPAKKKITTKEDDDSAKFASVLEAAIVTEKPNIRWEDIAGLEQAKKSLQEAVIYPIKYPTLFVGMRTPWKGILLYGPPGTGKTFLAKACATEADATFFTVSSADITSKYVGESEKLIKTLFNMARAKKPAIIFIDEIDSLLSARSDNENESSRRVKTEFLVQMQGVGNDDTGILVLGATNIPWGLDSAVRRRFEKRIYIPLPDTPAREALLLNQLKKTPNVLNEEDISYLAQRSEGLSCADLNILIRDASYEPLRKAQNAIRFKETSRLPNGKPVYQPCAPSEPDSVAMRMLDIPGDQLTLPFISLDDFESALFKTKPSVSKEDLVKQEEFTKSFGMEG
jgi:vacuolar protein-sorting-associated protein 4